MVQETTATTGGASLTEGDAALRDALMGRLFQATLGAMDLFNVYLGDRLGLYRALQAEPLTPKQLAAHTGTHERYVREWLEQQAVTGILEVDGAAGEVQHTAATGNTVGRRYRLPAGCAEVLLAQDSLSYLAYVGKFAACLGTTLPAVFKAFRTGGGVPWSAYGADAREGQAEQNRPIFLHLLGKEWLPAIPDLHVRLQAPHARVADIACGAGWSSIAVAQAYPEARVDGFDLDEASVALARNNAEAAGLGDRVHFHVRDAADPALAGRYDLVMICEALHDLSRPVEALQAMRGLLVEGGTVLVVDERTEEAFTAPGPDLERLFYGFSVLCCLPTGMADQPSAATGTVMRPETLRRYATEAGLGNMEILPIEHDLFRLYRLRPARP